MAGEPGGSVGFLSAAELRATGPGFTLAECGWQRFGDENLMHALDLDSACALLPGLPGRVDVQGAPGPGAGILGISAGASQVPLPSGQVLLLEFSNLQFELLDFDAAGRSEYAYTLPTSGLSVHTPAYLQAAYLDPAFVGGWRLSNGLIATPCIE